MIETAFLDESARGQDRVDFRGAAGGENIGGAGGEIDHGRHPPGRRHREHGDHAGIGGRQHDAERAAFARQRHQLAAEDRHRHQQPLVGQLAAHRIFDGEPIRAVQLGRLDQLFDHGAIGRRGAIDQVRHNGVERGAGGLPALAALELGVDLEFHRLEDRDRDFRKQPAAHLAAFQAAEDRRLRPLDADRHHHGVRLVGDHRRAVVDLHQAAGDGDAAFGKDHQHIAVAHRIDEVAHRERPQRVERHGAHEFEERLDPPVLRHRHVDGEDRALRQDRHRQRRIEEADVIERDDGIAAGLVDVLQAFDLEPEEGAEHDREKIVQPARRHGLPDGDGDREIGDADQREKKRRA